MKGFFFAVALVLASAFIAVPSFAHGGDHEDTTLASAVMNGVDNDENRDALKKFVMHAKAHVEEAELIEEFLTLLSEFRDEEGDWMAHGGSIYLYIFTTGETADGEHEELAVFNASNPAVEGLDLHEVTDANGKEVAHELIDAAEPGRDGFGEYTWDDPRIEGDEVDEAGKSPGTSDKVGYVVKVKLPGGESLTATEFILGSGFYPTPLPEPKVDDSDGCAIAGGTTGRDGLSPLFNLFLVVSALFLAVSWRTRTVGR